MVAMEYDDKVLANQIAQQRNIALNALAEANAVIVALQAKIAALEAKVAELEKPKE